MSYTISQYACLYNRHFIFCPLPDDLSKHWKYAQEHNYLVQAFILNPTSGCYERLTSGMVRTIIGE